MSKKDYQAIAVAFYHCRYAWNPNASHLENRRAKQQWITDVDAIASVLAADNPRFDRERFIEACETGKCRGMRQVS